MAAARSLDLVGPDLEAYMQESFNRLILYDYASSSDQKAQSCLYRFLCIKLEDQHVTN